MALQLRQQLKLSQQLVMTPQLQQAIRLLQMSRLELVETIQQELLENPFLEEQLEKVEEPVTENRADETAEAYDIEISRSEDWEDYLGEFASTPKQLQHRDFEVGEDMADFESRMSESSSLESHLMWQLRLSTLSEKEKAIGEVIIGNLASSGYLHTSVEDLMELSVASQEEVEAVLHTLQRFDPLGVAARSPKECLLIQIEVLGYDQDPVLVGLVEDHLEDLEAKRYKGLLKRFQLDMDDLREYLTLIQSLEPFPGASFGSTEPIYVSPDASVYKINGEFVIVLNEDGLPNLTISEMYEDCVPKDNEKDYFSEKIRSASWLIKSLHQRHKTLYKVLESIVKFQRTFFEEGVEKLRPLILKDIADDIGMHESTVSRITTNKYVSTAFGVFELKFFFNSAINLDDGRQIASESVKSIIKACIAKEDPKKPLSDERLGEILKEELNVNIARRTVAKYRMSMDIPSSSQRKVLL